MKYQNHDEDLQAIGRMLMTLRAKQLDHILEQLPGGKGRNKLDKVNLIVREMCRVSRSVEIDINATPPVLRLAFTVGFE